MKLRILSIMLAMFLFAQIAISAPFNANAKTKRIPAGTEFSLQLLNPITSVAAEGAEFSAILVTDQKEDNDVILPSGSLVRGTVKKIVASKRMSKGAVVYLDFDHVVTPNGRQIPLDLSVVQCNDRIYYDGGLYNSLGYGEAIKENYNKGVDITKNATEYGLSVGDTHPGLQFLTTPFCAVGGFIGGVGYVIGDSVADMFRKGKDVILTKGETITVQLINPIDVPVY